MNRIATLAQAVDHEILENSIALAVNESRRKSIQQQLRSKYASEEMIAELGVELDRSFEQWHEINNRLKALGNVYYSYNWQRAWIVSGGHVHSMPSGCPGFKMTTAPHLLPACSALTEDEIVDLAGDRACTFCFPSAPVDKLAQPSRLFALDEAAKAERKAERLTKAEEKEAKKVTVAFGEKKNRNGDTYIETETFGSVRSARTEALSEYGWLLWNVANQGGTSAVIYLERFQAITTAIIAHRDCEFGHIDALEADLIKRAEAKFVKESMAPDVRVGFKGRSREEAKMLLAEVNEKIPAIKAALKSKSA